MWYGETYPFPQIRYQGRRRSLCSRQSSAVACGLYKPCWRRTAAEPKGRLCAGAAQLCLLGVSCLWPLLVPGVWVLLPLKILSTHNIVWSLYVVERSQKYLLTPLLIVAGNLGMSCDLLIHFGIFICHPWHSKVLSHNILWLFKGF